MISFRLLHKQDGFLIVQKEDPSQKSETHDAFIVL